MSLRFSRFFATALLLFVAGAMLSVSFDAEARRMGGGRSFGRQSSNITQQRQATTPPAANTAPRAAGAAAGATAKSGMSRFLGPIAGIAAGLGIAALLSQFGLSGAFLEMLSSMVLIGLVIFAIMFIVRRFQGAASRPALGGAQGGGRPGSGQPGPGAQNIWRQSGTPSARPGSGLSGPFAGTAAAPSAAPVDDSWFIPSDFDTPAFLAQAKAQFVSIQGVWDSGDTQALTEYLTDDLIAELKPQALASHDATQTEIVLLNAELLGIEAVSGGHLASVRYSGMLRESKDTEAFRFEEIWNLYKADGAGWLLAGIQQIPVDMAS